MAEALISNDSLGKIIKKLSIKPNEKTSIITNDLSSFVN